MFSFQLRVFGLTIIHATLITITKFHLHNNVSDLVKQLPKKLYIIIRLSVSLDRCLWSNFSSRLFIDMLGTTFLFKYTRLVWPVPLAQVFARPQLIFPSKTWFCGIYLNFQQQKSLKNQYLPHSQSKSYQINSLKSCSSRSFQQHQSHIPIPLKISATI
jgi:hypothetical protein